MAETGEKIPASGILPDPGHRERYPWHSKAWAALTRSWERLPHAVLLHGPAGIGKRAFAWRFAHALLCSSRTTDGEACGACYSCGLYRAGTHPDLLSVGPAEDSAVITVDQVREVRDFLALRPHTARHKLVLAAPAEAMNVNAANALLKVLEEPPAGGLLVLTTARPGQLPATIRSRCTAIAFRPPLAADAVAWVTQQGIQGDPGTWLQLAGGAPLRALAAADSSLAADFMQLQKDVEALRLGQDEPLRCAARWKDIGAGCCLEWFQQYVAGRIRAEMTGPAQRQDKKIFSLYLKELFEFSDVISEARQLLDGPLDENLLVEDVLIRWHRIGRGMD
jgi:DNA polymerase III subunit delta'